MKLLVTMLLSAAGVPASAAPATFLIDPVHTSVRFYYSQPGYLDQVHRFDNSAGKIVLDANARAGSVDIVVDTDSLNTGNAALDSHIEGAALLDARKHPTITFKSTRLDFDGELPIAVYGNLTIKDVTWPVKLDVHALRCSGALLPGQACGATASTVIRRSEFNVGDYLPYVDDELTVRITIEATRQ